MIVDRPLCLGGDDLGPSPVEHVLAGYAGCINEIGHLIADEMGFEIRGLEVEMVGKLDPETLFGRPSRDCSGFREITVLLTIDTDARAETTSKWLKRLEKRFPDSDNHILQMPVSMNVKLTKRSAVV